MQQNLGIDSYKMKEANKTGNWISQFSVKTALLTLVNESE